jgi:hypothetical protein
MRFDEDPGAVLQRHAAAHEQGCSCRKRIFKLRVTLIETGGSRAYVS